MTLNLPFGIHFEVEVDLQSDHSHHSPNNHMDRPRNSPSAFGLHHSRAFAPYFTPDHGDDDDNSEESTFFVPSYLVGSTYIHKLYTAHTARQHAHREAKRFATHHPDTDFGSLPDPLLPPGSHKGIAHKVIERNAPHHDQDTPAPLPSRWNKDDMSTGLEIQPDGLSLKYVGTRSHQERDHEACAVRSNHHMPPQCGIYYYEVEILHSKRDDTTIAIGFCTDNVALSRPIGWEPESWAYHGDDGRCFTAQNTGRPYGPNFNQGDVIGCGVNFRENSTFFTRNGRKIGTAFHDVVKGKLYPAVSLKKPGEVIRANFGQAKFVYNIEDMMRDQRKKMQAEIQGTDTSMLEPGLSETDLIQTLVLQFLQHDGYVDTARAFAEEAQAQKLAMNLGPENTASPVNTQDDKDAAKRQDIRSAILDGEVDKAMELTEAFYPDVLKDNEQVNFHLRCRKFIEMVRQAAQMHVASGSTSGNGHVTDSASQHMDIDHNGTEDIVWDEDVEAATSPDLLDLERNMLQFGKALQTEYRKDKRKEVIKTLSEVWGLLAYKNPLKEPKVSHLLDMKGRAAVAEELNSAILRSLGKSSRASIETVYAQASVLLEDLRQDGGVGAFVSVQDVVDEIRKPDLP